LVYFAAIWYTLWPFGIFFPVLVFCTKKNLAALTDIEKKARSLISCFTTTMNIERARLSVTLAITKLGTIQKKTIAFVCFNVYVGTDDTSDQGCQIFLGTTYQNIIKYTIDRISYIKRLSNIQNGQKCTNILHS
jgi:hypothetical protein